MTGFLKGKAIAQIDKLLIDGKEYSEAEIKEAIKSIVKKKAKK